MPSASARERELERGGSRARAGDGQRRSGRRCSGERTGRLRRAPGRRGRRASADGRPAAAVENSLRRRRPSRRRPGPRASSPATARARLVAGANLARRDRRRLAAGRRADVDRPATAPAIAAKWGLDRAGRPSAATRRARLAAMLRPAVRSTELSDVLAATSLFAATTPPASLLLLILRVRARRGRSARGQRARRRAHCGGVAGGRALRRRPVRRRKEAAADAFRRRSRRRRRPLGVAGLQGARRAPRGRVSTRK